MKKLIIILFVALGLIAGVYWALNRDSGEKPLEPEEQSQNQSKKEEKLNPDTKANTEIAKSEEGKGNQDNQKIEDELEDPEEEKLPEEEKDRYSAYFTEVDQKWEKRMEELFIKDLAVGESKFETYKKMRAGFESDKMEAFQEFHAYMKSQYGENYTYRPNEDEKNFSSKVKTVYEQKLQELIGENGMHQYHKAREDFNKNQRENFDPEIGVYEVEF